MKSFVITNITLVITGKAINYGDIMLLGVTEEEKVYGEMNETGTEFLCGTKKKWWRYAIHLPIFYGVSYSSSITKINGSPCAMCPSIRFA